MKKDKEWLKEEINKVTSRVYGADFNTVKETDYLIDQLEEPEETKLSEPTAWKIIAKIYRPEEVYWGDIRKQYIESLDKQKNPVIPQFVADRIEEYREIRFGLSLIFTIDDQTEDDIDFSKWLSADSENCEKVARAWLDGYTVEKEKLYRVELIRGKYLIYNHKNNQLHNQELDAYVGDYEQREFTEQEIKAIDERYWAFAEEVTE